jgi:uridine kinase
VNHKFEKDAWSVLAQSAKDFGFVATAQDTDNYARLWSRDSAIASLAILAHGHEALYPTVKSSILNLLDAIGDGGVFPSNVSFDKGGTRSGQSFGGPVGRTDSPFWWAVTALSYMEVVQDFSSKDAVAEAIEEIERRAQAWEFNNKHLMYSPASSNWADEYPVEGYILLNNVLRLWMLTKASRLLSSDIYADKARKISGAVKYHFFGEPAEAEVLFTPSQLKQVKDLEGGDRILMSFTPGGTLNHIDTLGWSLSILLGISSESTTKKMVERLRSDIGGTLAPAHWPIIDDGHILWGAITSNYAYNFKNHPGHFHNGGVWGLTQGFTAAAMNTLFGEDHAYMVSYEGVLESSMEDHPFAEYYSYPELKPGGVKNLCFSAGSYLIAAAAADQGEAFTAIFERRLQVLLAKAEKIAEELAREVVQKSPAKVYRVSGESGCGKTTLAKAIVQEYEAQGKKAVLISQDEYFHLPPRQNHNKRVEDFEWIGLGEVDWKLLNGVIDQFLDSEAARVEVPEMDWELDTKEWKTMEANQVDVVVIEGTYVLSEKRDGEVGIFFEHTYVDTRENRLARNREVVDDFIQLVLEREHGIISTLRENADLVVNKDYTLTIR